MACPDAVLLQAVFRFAFLRGYVVISNQGGKWWGWVLPFFVHFGVPVFVRIGSFLLCFACLPWLHLRAGACVSGLVGVFLGFVGGSSSSAFDYLDFSMDSTLVWIGV